MTTGHVEPKPRRRGMRWIIALGIIAVLIVAAWFGGEAIARSVVTSIIQDKLAGVLGVKADHPMDITLDGAVLPQVIGGHLDHVSVATKDVKIGPFTGDVTGQARTVDFDGNAQSITAELTIPPSQLAALIPTDTIRVDDVTIDGSALTATSSIEVFGISTPLAVSMRPSADAGQIVLEPESITIGTLQVDASAAEKLPGGLGQQLTRPVRFCIADRLPQGITITNIALASNRVVVTADIAGKIATDSTLQANGSCAA